MSTRRVINKYPNRRLYDTEESRYITLTDIRNLVLESVEFVVVDKKDGSDITRCILLQVISEREQQEEPVMSQHFLSEIIRTCQNGSTARLAAHLEQSLSTFLQYSRRAAERSSTASETANTSVRHWKPAERKQAG